MKIQTEQHVSELSATKKNWWGICVFQLQHISTNWNNMYGYKKKKEYELLVSEKNPFSEPKLSVLNPFIESFTLLAKL